MEEYIFQDRRKHIIVNEIMESKERKAKIKKEYLKKEIVDFKPKTTVDLTSAKYIVSGGLGLGKASGFKLIQELAMIDLWLS